MRTTLVRRLAAAGFTLVAASMMTTPLHGGETADARRVFDPVPAAPDTVRVLVYYDMEGLAGLSDWHGIFYRYTEPYVLAQKFLAADVNAVVDGLFAGGATQVNVVDSHGSGNPEPDLPLDKLDSRARPVIRDMPFESYSGLLEPAAYEAIVAVGMHGKTGSGGFAAHTYGLGKEIIFNGQSTSETELIAYSWGRVGVPVIMVTGDDTTKADLKQMPWIEFVVVKTSLSSTSVELRSIDKVHREMREAAKRAVINRARMKAMALTEPINATVRSRPPASLAMLDGVPGVDYANGQVNFTATDFESAYRGVESLIRVADLANNEILYNVIRGENHSVRKFSRSLSTTCGLRDSQMKRRIGSQTELLRQSRAESILASSNLHRPVPHPSRYLSPAEIARHSRRWRRGSFSGRFDELSPIAGIFVNPAPATTSICSPPAARIKAASTRLFCVSNRISSGVVTTRILSPKILRSSARAGEILVPVSEFSRSHDTRRGALSRCSRSQRHYLRRAAGPKAAL